MIESASSAAPSGGDTGSVSLFSRTDHSYDETWTEQLSESTSQQQRRQQNPANGISLNQTNNTPNSKPPLHPSALSAIHSPSHPLTPGQQPSPEPTQSAFLEASEIRRKKLATEPVNAPKTMDESSTDDHTSTDGGFLRATLPEQRQIQEETSGHQYRITVETTSSHVTGVSSENNDDSVPVVVQPIWDSSDRRQFPMLEIERMKNKTSKLRSQQQQSERASYHTAFSPGRFDPHAGIQMPVVTRAGSGSLDGSRSTKSSSSLGQSVRRKKRGANSEGRIWSSSPTNYNADNDSSLGDILDQSSADTTRSSVKKTEQSLQHSFSRRGRRRNRMMTPSPTPKDQTGEEEESSLDHSSPRKPHFYPVKLAPITPESPSRASEAPTEEMVSNDDASTMNNSSQQEKQKQGPPGPHEEENQDFTMHDLCGEASSTDDIAWRNALYLLSLQPQLASLCDTEPQLGSEQGRGSADYDDDDDSDDDSSTREGADHPDMDGGGQGWTPLHISCLGLEPPPTFMTRALLYANPRACQWRDDGGRLPLHLLAASSADVRTMELLLKSYPQAISKRDAKGLTPLHLLLRNKSVPLTVQNVSVLLGLTTHPSTGRDKLPQKQMEQERFLLHRRGEHLNMTLKDMERYIQNRHKPVVTVFHPDYDEFDEEWDTFPPDVQVALRKLAKWRRRQLAQVEHDEHVQKQPHPRQEEADEEDEFWEETNPAAIPHFPDLKLPIHMAVSRGIVQPAPLDDLTSMGASEDAFEDEGDQEVGTQQDSPSSQKQFRSSVEDVYNVLRCIISAFPEGLCVRDADGLTPLLHVMTMTDGLPNLDLIELLLGKRSGAFEEIPPWLSDLPLHSITTLPARHNRFLCPAMVASARTYQLPLHIAAEEFLSDMSIVETIYKSYPAAVDVQDYRGRTPLHLVFSNYRLFPADPGVIALLLSDSSSKTRDAEGNLPFDLLIESAEYLPKRLPSSWEADDMARIYQKFFAASLMASTLDGKKPSHAADFLHQLRQLPPWIRRQACSVTYVQELVIEELSSPWRTACIILDGVLLVATLTFFRVQVKNYTETSGIWGEEVDELRQLDQSVDQLGEDNQSDMSVDEVYSLPVYACIAARTMILCVRTILAANISQVYYLVLLNGWFWIDVCAMGLTFATSFLFNTISDESVLAMATGATGLLWLSLLGYWATWSFGMALLLGSLSRIANQIIWPVLAGGMVVVAFAQMFYTLLWVDCADAIPTTQVCSMRDAYRVVYLLLRGESLVDEQGNDQISMESIILIAGFLLLLFLLTLAVLVAVIMGALHTNTDEVAFRSFWEPKLAFVLSSSDWGCRKEPKYKMAPSARQNLQTRMEHTWELLLLSLMFGVRNPKRTEKKWYNGHRARENALSAPLWLVSLIVVPLWFAAGLLTLGLLWPPQLRRMLFRPLGWDNRRRSPSSTAEFAASELSGMRSELVRVKTMSYERSVQVEREVREVKQLLFAAMHED
uniref:Ion transport domain-containing protein n=1 Tax=Entomoneis paludosa TaxID=265537 RepID=A0A7S2Y3R1_9STRA|mmetsp:Transcript_14039/g.29097  ORF Transcript_14039/g.29097 Transcript_14039/m.29097 type:complete len:1474 (+) Transcript_14039:143-4564(+)